MPIINTKHVATANNTKQVRWDHQTSSFAQRVWDKRTREFAEVPVEQSFAMDIWQTRHGYEAFTGGRSVTAVPISSPLPAAPEGKHAAIYTLPIYSGELGGQQELVIRGEAITQALSDLFDAIEPKLNDQSNVPVIDVAIEATDSFGTAPVFHVTGWMPRPASWGKVLVDFSKLSG